VLTVNVFVTVVLVSDVRAVQVDARRIVIRVAGRQERNRGPVCPTGAAGMTRLSQVFVHDGAQVRNQSLTDWIAGVPLEVATTVTGTATPFVTVAPPEGGELANTGVTLEACADRADASSKVPSTESSPQNDRTS